MNEKQRRDILRLAGRIWLHCWRNPSLWTILCQLLWNWIRNFTYVVRENLLIKIQTGARLNFWYAKIKHIVGQEIYFQIRCLFNLHRYLKTMYPHI